MSRPRVIAERNGLVVGKPNVEQRTVALARRGGPAISLTASDLKWLIHTAAPAALQALVRPYPTIQEDTR